MSAKHVTAVFWFRQTINVVVWWFALGALGSAFARGAEGGMGSALLKAAFFVSLAAFVTWKLPPFTQGVPAVWWARFVFSVSLWLHGLERLWAAVAARVQADPAASFGNAVLFAAAAAAVTWFTMPREMPGG